MKTFGLYILGLLVLLVLVAIGWSMAPIRTDMNAPDPAVELFNESAVSDRLLTESWFKHRGLNLHYVEAGQGETIIFVHGFPSFWLSHIHQMRDLALDHHVVAIDGLGAGLSDAPSEIEAYQLERMTAHLAALMDHIGVQKAHLVGHDWGSAFVMGFAQRYPEKVSTVTGISVPPQNVMLRLFETSESQRAATGYIERIKRANSLLLVAFGVSKRINEGAYAPLIEQGKLTADEGEAFRRATANAKRINAHINWYRANLPAPEEVEESDYWPSRDARITQPALFIWGEDDEIVTPEAILELQAITNQLETLSFKGVGHWPHVEQADAVTARIRQLLRVTP